MARAYKSIGSFISEEPMSGCWLWLGAISGRVGSEYGYYRPYHAKNAIPAHRHVYELYRGKVPKDMELHHKCENKLCVNPCHLEIVASRRNTLFSNNACALNARKTHCAKGHEFTVANTHLRNNGARRCKTCMSTNYR